MKRHTNRGATAAPAALCAAAALCAVAALPGTAAAEDAPEPPAYRTAEDAQAVSGTASSADGPELRAGRVHSDTIGPNEGLYYRVTLDARSNAHVSAVAAVPHGAELAYGDGIKVSLQSPDGTECDSQESGAGSGEFPRPFADAASRNIEPDGDCQSAGSYLVKVTRTDAKTSTPVDWPLELSFVEEPGVSDGPTTAPDEESWNTEPPAPPTGDPKKVAGGTGFNDAPATGDGNWRDTIRPGETRFYRVPVDWGQQLAVAAELANAEVTSGNPYVGTGLMLRLHNTVRAQVGSDGTPWTGKQTALQFFTPPADYANRFSGGEGEQMRFAGWYYVSVSLSPEVAEHTKGPVDLTLRVAVKGEAQQGPAYDGDAAAAGFAVDEDDREQAANGRTPADADRNGTLEFVGFAGIGAGTVLLLGLGGWTLAARRRAAALPVTAAAGTIAAGAAPVGAAPAAGIPGQPEVPEQHGHRPGHQQEDGGGHGGGDVPGQLGDRAAPQGGYGQPGAYGQPPGR
ncbi:hypothetical protein [Streptomyces lycii]|uniref:hypothetical protein n=1 Tax=Streptomyces lycii TaxID=2654337 RepID=UPI00159D0D04|nr:hypothetical protein [Streptomyces lycii]